MKITKIPNFWYSIIVLVHSFICRVRNVFTFQTTRVNPRRAEEKERISRDLVHRLSFNVVRPSILHRKACDLFQPRCGSTSVLFKLPWPVSGTH